MKTCVIFGGAGFIGCFFAVQVLQDGVADKVILADLEPICERRFLRFLQPYLDAGVLERVFCDVRIPISTQIENINGVNLIANFAAIHREPGHDSYEYYETNLLGAENVCNWAAKVGCKGIIFTSSIAPYGHSETPKTEEALPVPITAYGRSKLVAEKIHLSWVKETGNRTLTIVRPGVVFGPGEGGNVSRLIKATLNGYFFYMGNHQTRKAGTYVRELTCAMLWVHNRSKKAAGGSTLFNMTMSPAPSMVEYVDTILLVAGRKKWVPNIPFGILYPISFIVDGLAKFLRVNQPISPVRLRKLIKSNQIVPKYLLDADYKYKYSLNSALEEWKQDAPEEWGE